MVTKRRLLQLGSALLLAGCAGDGAQPARTGNTANAAVSLAPGPEVPPQLAPFHGRWSGIWDSNPDWTSVLNVTSVSPTGEVTGTYVYMQMAPSRFQSQVTDGAFGFGPSRRFVFTMRPDGRLAGVRTVGGETNTIVLRKQ